MSRPPRPPAAPAAPAAANAPLPRTLRRRMRWLVYVPENTALCRRVARVLRGRGRLSEAERYLRRSLNLRPDDAPLLLELARCFAATDRVSAASAVVESLAGRPDLAPGRRREAAELCERLEMRRDAEAVHRQMVRDALALEAENAGA